MARPAAINTAASVRSAPSNVPVAESTGAALAVLDGVLVAGVLLALLDGVGLVPHRASVKVLASRVTEPVRARARPSTVARVVTLTEVSAMIVPTNDDRVPRVAELATCQ